MSTIPKLGLLLPLALLAACGGGGSTPTGTGLATAIIDPAL